jgi:L-idonate 5-dehydrogenase
MPAVVVHGAGDLRIEEVADRSPGPGEVQVRVRYGGICGSDIHYFEDGAAGRSTIREPLVLGHELAGEVSALGPGVDGLTKGQRVTIRPAKPCGECGECRAVPIPDSLPLLRAALAEPLAVALRAVDRLGGVGGSTVLVVGAGPIGLLTVGALRLRGAAQVIARDVTKAPLDLAISIGADAAELAGSKEGAGPVDGAIECSGSDGGLATALQRTKRRGRVVEVGMMGESAPVDVSRLVTNEIELVGSFRFDGEIFDSVELLTGCRDFDQVVAASFPIRKAADAFAFASDPGQAGKVMLEI